MCCRCTGLDEKTRAVLKLLTHAVTWWFTDSSNHEMIASCAWDTENLDSVSCGAR
jgi:Arc/MetJ family transcription regulator